MFRKTARFSGDYNLTLPDDDPPDLTSFLQAVDELPVVPHPNGIKLHIDKEYKAAAKESKEAYRQRGLAAAARFKEFAARLKHAAQHALAHSTKATERAEHQMDREMRAQAVMNNGYATRTGKDLVLYYVRFVLIMLGDIAGIYGAALLLGEEPINALFQATSSATAAITLGACGRELKHWMAANSRKMDPADMTDEQAEFAPFFMGSHGSGRILAAVVSGCIAGLLLISGAVFALRDATEGLIPAVVFGCLSLAIGLACFYNSFSAACEPSDYLASQAARSAKLNRKAAKLARDPAIANYHAALAADASIRRIYRAAGRSAAFGLRRSLFKVKTENAGIAGHGHKVRPRWTSSEIPWEEAGPDEQAA